MPVIVPAGNFNPASLQADDLYITIQNPPGFIAGVPTDVIGLVGTASWGPVNQPVHMGSPFDALQAWGAVGAAALTDPYDLATDLAIAFGQAGQQGNLEGWAVRVTDGTDVAASGNIAGATTSSSITATVVGPVAADTVQLTFTSSVIAGSPLTIPYTVPASPSPTATTVAAALVALINASAPLIAVGIWASNLAGVVSIFQPTALSPQATVARTVTGTVAVTLATAQASSTAGLVLQALYTGVAGNSIVCTLQTGANANTTTALIALPQFAITEIYPNLANATFFSLLKSALANGLSGVRGPSQIARGGAVNIAVGTPTAGNYTISGGTDGRAGVVTATLLGSDTAVPKTGLYALRNLRPAIGLAWIVGSTDSVLPASLLPFGQTEGCTTLWPFAAGTSTATAVAAIASSGQHDPSYWALKDWVYWFDAVNNQVRLVPPTAFIGGLTATLLPSQNPGNQPVSLVLGTERNNPLTGNLQPYSLSEIGQLASAGIGFISNPIPAGAQWGIREGQTTSLNPVTAGVEWWRTSAFLARSFAAILGKYVNQNQSQQPNDPLRNAIKHDSNAFLGSLVGSNGAVGIIDDFTTICTFSANGSAGNGQNNAASVAQHYLYVLWRVRYLSTVRFLIGSLQGGTTVVTVGSTPGQQLQ